MDIEIVIRPFGAIYYRTTFYSYTTTVIGHILIGFYHTHRHIETNLDIIAFLPTSVNCEITVFKGSGHFVAIHFYSIPGIF